MKARAWPRSLRARLLAATLVALALALGAAGAVLAALFRDHAQAQFDRLLDHQLEALAAGLSFDAQGRPQPPAAASGDPRWQRPHSGLYWQVDAQPAPGQPAQRGVLRSRSLWDVTLALPEDALADGAVHRHDLLGPGGAPLRVAERSVRSDEAAGRWRLLVAADAAEARSAVRRFDGVLAASLAALGLLLALAAWAQVAVGLQPLQRLKQALTALQRGGQARLAGPFPSEVQPLVDALNAVLEQRAQGLERARTQAGNLAHAIKTPLAVLQQAAAAEAAAPAAAFAAPSGTPGPAPAMPSAPPAAAEVELAALRQLVREQVAAARRHVDAHLARARAAAAHGAGAGQRAELAPLAQGLARVMRKLHAQRELELALQLAPDLAFAGEAQDLQEMLGNLMDNACRWARHRVQLHGERLAPAAPGDAPRLRLTLDDDGPGIAAERREAALGRGVRLDETAPGSGLGLAIAQELAGLYGGSLRLQQAPQGGLRAVLELPAAG